MMRRQTTSHGQRTESPERGFALLLAVLISGIILSVGLAVFNITFKELRLSSAGRESQFAFYAADSGIECALYHERKQNAFAASTPPALDSIECNGSSIPVTKIFTPPSTYTRTFHLELEPNRYCADVTITKMNSGSFDTTITSRGTNTCNTPDTRRVERAIIVDI